MIDREKYIAEHGGQLTPLFEVVDELLDAIRESQGHIAASFDYDMPTTIPETLNNLIDTLDDEKLVKLMRGLEQTKTIEEGLS